ncbi:LysR substrate-binding domain-containing protein [Pseudoxanthomonas winnipegensis]|uniref:LysR substrate-binding domain-containing protein n=1 Tax=Pseudoxanthomonas winnipegensis TaxID=2480810 RepID=UPI0013EF23F4
MGIRASRARAERARRRAGHLNASHHIVAAALDGLGVAFLPEDEFAPHNESGELVRVLARWCPPFPVYHLYYPSRRQPSPAFRLVVDALRVQVRFGSFGVGEATTPNVRYQPEVSSSCLGCDALMLNNARY